MKRVEDWKARLIDLSRKNNLLYFHKSKSGNLKITQPEPQKIFNVLVLKKKYLEFWLPPQEVNLDELEKPKAESKNNSEIDRIGFRSTRIDSELRVTEKPKIPLPN